MSKGKQPKSIGTIGDEGRDERGRFAKGNPGGPGAPRPECVVEFKRAMLAATSAEDVAAITRALIEKAKAGDVAAAGLLYDRWWGKAKQHFEIEGVNVSAHAERVQAIVQSDPALLAEMNALARKMAHRDALPQLVEQATETKGSE
jgi:hypothetical protein